MSKSHDKSQNAFLKRIEKFFTGKKPSQYLEEHRHYDSFDDEKYARSPESFPYLPYSLQDLLASKRISGKNILVASHRSTALWLHAGANKVTLARPRHGGGGHPSSRLTYLESYKSYTGDPLDIIVWDSHSSPEDWEEFIARALSPRGVVIFVSSQIFDALENGMGILCEHLTKLGMRRLEFRNPGPRREIITAILYYPRDNVLDI